MNSDADGTNSGVVLSKNDFGAYDFEHGGVAIHHPARSECGRFWVGPACYGFERRQDAGGGTFWRKSFELEDGRKVEMEVRQASQGGVERDELEEGVTLDLRVCFAPGVWIEWLQDDGCVDDCPPREVKTVGWTEGLQG